MSDQDAKHTNTFLQLIYEELKKSNETQEKILQYTQMNYDRLKSIESSTSASNYHLDAINSKTRG